MHREAHEADDIGENAARGGAFDFGLVQRGVGLPERGFVNEVWRGVQGFGQGFDVFEFQRRFDGAAVEDLQGGDFIAVFGDEGFEGFHHAFGAFAGGFAEIGE